MPQTGSALSPGGESWQGTAEFDESPMPSSIKSREHRRKTVVETAQIFSGISPDDCTKISTPARVKEYMRGEVIYFEGDPASQVVLIISGLVKVTKLGSSGAEVILRLAVPGDVLGAVGAFTTGRHFTSARAFRSCVVLVWDSAVFKVLMERFIPLHQNMGRILGRDLSELEERFREVATEKVATRVSRQVIRLAGKIGRRVEGGIDIALSREELAQMTGTTLFTVSRLLSGWEELGIVKPRREAITVCNFQMLREVSERS